MSHPEMPAGTVHELPDDLGVALTANTAARDAWLDITPLARNEFICWILEAKQPTTRERRVRRSVEELVEGKRRPCCWIGCIHRTDKEISPSVRGILAKRTSKSPSSETP